MKNKSLKQLSVGLAAALIVVLLGLAGFAMFFEDEAEELTHLVKTPKSTQPLELQGKWLGMKLVGLKSQTAMRWGIPPTQHGIVVAEISERAGLRARQAGVLNGDVIEAVDNNEIRDMADLFDISRKIDIAEAIFLDVVRWGQPMTLVLPALYTPYVTPAPTMPAGTPPAVPQMVQPQQMVQQPQVMPQAQAQVVPVAPTPPAVQPGQPAAFVTPPQGGQYFCPRGGLSWPQTAVHPHYRCPHCNGPLTGVR